MSIITDVFEFAQDLIMLPYRMRRMSEFRGHIDDQLSEFRGRIENQIGIAVQDIKNQVLSVEKRLDAVNEDFKAMRETFANLQWEFAQHRTALDRQAASAMLLTQKLGDAHAQTLGQDARFQVQPGVQPGGNLSQ